jgi:hypothetical protein
MERCSSSDLREVLISLIGGVLKGKEVREF